MENEPSPLATLRQLKEWLDAGAITPTEFEVLKRKLLFSELNEPGTASTVPPASSASPPAATPIPAPPPAVPAPEPLPPPPPSWEFKHDPRVTIEPAEGPMSPPAAATSPPPPQYPDPKPITPPAATAPPIGAVPLPPLERPREQSQTPPKKPAPPIDTFTKPVEMVKVGTSSYRDADSLTPAESAVGESRRPRPAAAPNSPSRSPLTTILIVGGILALFALIAYLLMDDRESERLTSLSRAGADTVNVVPEVGPQAEQLSLPPVADTDTARVTPALPTTRPAATVDTATRAASVPAPVASAPAGPPDAATAPTGTTSGTAPANEQDDDAPGASPAPAATPTPSARVSDVEARVRGALSAYYEDLKTPPFNAAQHFAPTVERFYTMQNTTPSAINAELERSHFPEFLEGETQGVPGSLNISEPVRDGSRVVTFLEKSRAFRKSRQQYQNTTAQVRIRFDRDFKIVYLRQERLLENTFSE